MCPCNTPKKEKWFQKCILEVKTATNTWRESGDWVALHNIISRGSTHISDGKWTLYNRSKTYCS